jgi:hypothetical protein
MATASLASSKAKVRASATDCGQLHVPRLGRGRNWALAGLPTPIATNPSLRLAPNATLVTNALRPSGSEHAGGFAARLTSLHVYAVLPSG